MYEATTVPRITRIFAVALSCVCSTAWCQQPVEIPEDTQRNINQTRACVTEIDHNRPDPFFPGLGDFIGWLERIDRMSNGDLLLVHSAGYWHASFAQPEQIESQLRQRWTNEGWPLDFPAPTSGRRMACRSTDNDKTRSKPFTIMDHRLDDGAHAILTCRNGTVLCFVGVQAS